MTNRLDPERTPVRLLIMGMTVVSPLMAVAIPDAFGGRAVFVAAGYVAVQRPLEAFEASLAGQAGPRPR